MSSLSQSVVATLAEHGFRSRDDVSKRGPKLTLEQMDVLLEEIARLYCDSQASFIEEFRSSSEQTTFFPESGQVEEVDVVGIKTLCLYADQLIVSNPLISLNPDINKVLEVQDGGDRRLRQRRRVLNAISSLLEVREMLTSDVLRLWPRELLVDTQPHITHCILGHDLLSAPALAFARRRIGVEARRIGNGEHTRGFEWHPHPNGPNTPSRTILLFWDDGSGGRLQLFAKPDHLQVEEETVEGSLPFGALFTTETLNKPIDEEEEEEYDLWRDQVRQSMLLQRVRGCYDDLVFTSTLNSHFVARFPSTWELMQLQQDGKAIFEEGNNSSSRLASALLQLDLPYLENLSAADLIRLRGNQSEFDTFRRTMRDFERDLKVLPSDSRFGKEVRQLQKDRLDTSLKFMNKSTRRAVEKTLVRGSLAVAPLVISAVAGKFVPESAFISAASLLAQWGWDGEARSQNSLAFLWKAQRAAKHSKRRPGPNERQPVSAASKIVTMDFVLDMEIVH